MSGSRRRAATGETPRQAIYPWRGPKRQATTARTIDGHLCCMSGQSSIIGSPVMGIGRQYLVTANP